MDNQPTDDLWTTLAATAADARRRLQRRSPAWWRDATPAGETRADRVARLVAELAALDPTAHGRGAPPRPGRDATLADQLAVVAGDLERERAEAAEAAVRAIRDALRDVDPRR
ncbi:MAG TPA: hypothetical protein VF519_11105 [Mycobacteriales bacterium]